MNLAGIIVAGDFNGRHGNWGDKKDNQQVKKLVDLVENLKLNVWSKYVGNSFQCSEGGSRIDLVLSDLDVAITQEIDDETVFSVKFQLNPTLSRYGIGKKYFAIRKRS